MNSLEELLGHHGDTSVEELSRIMMEDYCVKVVHETAANGDDRILLKYGIKAPWEKMVPLQCRGAIFRRDSGLWVRESWPFDKFFNHNEGHCILDDDFLRENMSDLFIEEKVDGTCIQLWWDEPAFKWRASTLGTLSPHKIYGADVTFDELFFSLVGVAPHDLEDWIDRDMTYMFEVCSSINRAVTEYPSDRVYFLGSRNMEFLRDEGHNPFGSPIPRRFRLDSLGIGPGMKELFAWVADKGEEQGDIIDPEGFVVTHRRMPIAKIKHVNYLRLHRFGGGETWACKVNNVIDAFFDGTVDDYKHVFDARLLSYLNRLDATFFERAKEYAGQIASLKGSYSDRKSFALAVNEKVSNQVIRGLCFRQMERAAAGDIEYGDVLGYIIENYRKFDWKTGIDD